MNKSAQKTGRSCRYGRRLFSCRPRLIPRHSSHARQPITAMPNAKIGACSSTRRSAHKRYKRIAAPYTNQPRQNNNAPSQNPFIVSFSLFMFPSAGKGGFSRSFFLSSNRLLISFYLMTLKTTGMPLRPSLSCNGQKGRLAASELPRCVDGPFLISPAKVHLRSPIYGWSLVRRSLYRCNRPYTPSFVGQSR